MSKLNAPQTLLALLGLLVCLIFFEFFHLLSFPDSETILKKGDTIKLYPGQTFKQTFVANRDNLNRMEWLLRTPGPRKGDAVEVTIADETCTVSLRQCPLKPAALNADNLFVASFPPIENSRDQRYCAIISYSTGVTETKYLRFFTAEDSQNKLFLSPSDAVAENRSLVMRSVYNNDTVWQDLRELNQRISQYKPWFLKDLSIAMIGVLFVTLSLSLIVALVTLKIENKHD